MKRTCLVVICLLAVYVAGVSWHDASHYAKYMVPSDRSELSLSSNQELKREWNRVWERNQKGLGDSFKEWKRISVVKNEDGSIEVAAPHISLSSPAPNQIVGNKGGVDYVELGGGHRLWLKKLSVSRVAYSRSGVSRESIDYSYPLGEIVGRDSSKEIDDALTHLSFEFQSEESLELFKGDQVNGLNESIIVRLFDAKTGSELDSSFARRDKNTKSLTVDFEAFLWHDTELKVVFDLVHGPTKSASFSANTDWQLDFEGLKIKPLLFAEGIQFWPAPHSIRTRHPGNLGRWVPSKMDPFEIQSPDFVDPDGPTSRRNRFPTTVVMAVAPQRAIRQIEIGFVDQADRGIYVFGNKLYSPGVHVDVGAKIEEIKSINIRYFPYTDRIVFTIPQVPGVPPENRKVDNLMLVRIPYLKIESKKDLFQTITNTLQITVNDYVYPIIQSQNDLTFPIILTNMSPEALLKLVNEDVLEGQATIVVDEEKLEFITGDWKLTYIERMVQTIDELFSF